MQDGRLRSLLKLLAVLILLWDLREALLPLLLELADYLRRRLRVPTQR